MGDVGSGWLGLSVAMMLAATYRARQIAMGSTPQVEVDKDKPTVLPLNEAAFLAGQQAVTTEPAPA